MTLPARDRLAGLLGGQAEPAASSVQLKAKADDLHVEVRGAGRLRFPVPDEQARQLCQLGQPARFGRGEQTLTDPGVRDTWEIPKHLVRVDWGEAFETVLDAVRDGLGLPAHCQLAADFHSMLVYEPGQFFVTHQDSEKDDTMVGTLVITLPSVYTGGELVIEDGGESVEYRGSKFVAMLVAFYADCRHEVLPVKSGHRITLTYNLLLKGDTGGPGRGGDAIAGELARCLDEHFTTQVTNPYSHARTDPPNRLVYLLDHEYTARGLSWDRLKGADANRVSLLRAAASRSGCEAVLALADIQETWDAYPASEGYGSREWDDYEDDDYEEENYEDDEEDSSGEYELQDLIDSSMTLIRWIGPAGDWSEDISLSVADAEVCATTRSADLRPYSSQYEGYMGNYGNTLDRWYHRAAVVLWPRDRSFTNRAEASPAWALDELGASVRAGDLAGARPAAATLAPFWDTAARTQGQAAFLGKALRTASALDDADTAMMLLRPFRIETLELTHVPALAKLARHYGEQRVGELLRTWFGARQTWAYAGDLNRAAWTGSLPGLCEALHAKAGPGTAIAHRLLALSWDWLSEDVSQWLAVQSPSRRGKQLGDLAGPLAAILTAVAGTQAASLREEIVSFARQQDEEVTAWIVPALRAAAGLPADLRQDGGFGDLAADCALRLRTRLSRPPRADDDWSAELPAGCACELCGALRRFLADPAQHTYEWPLATDGRRHVHSRIDAAELPVRHETRRKGRPYTLVLTKTQALFENERQARTRDQADLEWLTSEWPPARGQAADSQAVPPER